MKISNLTFHSRLYLFERNGQQVLRLELFYKYKDRYFLVANLFLDHSRVVYSV